MGRNAVVYLSPVGLCTCKWRFYLELRSLRPLDTHEIPRKKHPRKKDMTKIGPLPFLPPSSPHTHWVFTNAQRGRYSQEVVSKGNSGAAPNVGGTWSPDAKGEELSRRVYPLTGCRESR